MKQRVTPADGRHILLQIAFLRPVLRRTMELPMKLRLFVLGLATALAAGGALAQPGGRHGGGDRHMQRQMQRQMPPPERRMTFEDRQRLREQVQGGQMTRDEARQQYREERARRELDPGRAQQREQIRRDVIEANRNLQRAP